MVRRLFDHTFYFLEARSFCQLTDPALFVFMSFRRVYSIKDQEEIKTPFKNQPFTFGQENLKKTTHTHTPL